MATPSDGQGFKTKDKPAGERPDICPVPLNANAPEVGRATPSESDAKKVRDILKAAALKHPEGMKPGMFTDLLYECKQLVADEREAVLTAAFRLIKGESYDFRQSPSQFVARVRLLLDPSVFDEPTPSEESKDG